MFAYTVYPRTSNVGKVDPVRAVQPAQAVWPVQSVKPVESTWRKQFSGDGQTHRAQPAQQARGDYVRFLKQEQVQAAQNAETAVAQRTPVTSEASAMQIRGGRQTFLEQRSVKPTRDGSYIRKYVEQLNLARDQAVKTRLAHVRLEELSRNHGTAKSALLGGL